MQTITIPADVTVQIDLGDMPDGKPIQVPPKTITFVRDFLRRVVLMDKQWGASFDMLNAAADLRGLFSGKNPGDKVELSEDLYKKLCDVSKNPSEPYNPAFMLDGIVFLNAIHKPEKG